MAKTETTRIMPIIHLLIGLALCFSGFFLPEPSIIVEPTPRMLALNLPRVDGGLLLNITHTGVIVTMIFLGVVYLWTFVDTVWPCFFGVVLLIFSGFAPAPKILNLFAGNPIIVMTFFIFMLSSAIIYSDLAGWIARYLLSRKYINGKPWILTITILLITYFVSFLEAVATCLLMWPVLFNIFKSVGYKKGDRYVNVMTVYICMMSLMAFATDAFKGGSFFILSNLMDLSMNDPQLNAPIINIGLFIVFGLIISLCSIFLLILLMKFILKVDVTPLKNMDQSVLQAKNMPPMNLMQKAVLFDFIFYAVWMLTPSIIGTNNVVGAFLQKNSLAGSLVAVCVLSMIYIKGKKVINVTVSNNKYPWGVYLMFAVAMLLGGVMTSQGTNVAPFMGALLHKIFFGVNPILLSIAVLALGMLLTNFCNSVVLGIVLTPVLVALAHAVGMAAAPLIAIFTYTVMIAACTPAGSVYSALLFGNMEWVDMGDLIKYSVIASAVILGVVIVVGIPLSFMLF